MGTEETGVRLVARDEQKFTGAMARSRNAVAGFVSSVNVGSANLAIFNTIGMAVGTTVGNLVADAIKTGARAMLELASGGIQAAASIQTVSLSLETLSARELVSTGAAKDMTTALDQAGPIAQDLLGRLRDLSVASPFEYKDILTVFQLNTAFGQSTDMSLKLTKAITDMGAAMGRGGYDLERIAYNFSQMTLVGKVTQRDVRDLALAGVDLSRVLREKLGLSIDEVNAKLAAGQLTMEQVSQAFVDYAAENFGGAAERMSRTFTGLLSSLKDLFTFSSIDLFGSSLDTVTDRMGRLFDRIREFVDSGALRYVGDQLNTFVAGLMDVGDTAEDALGRLTSSMGVTFEDLVDRSFSWGYNIIDQVGAGMIQGAVSVIDALTFVGSVIATWLQPGSPPKITPELDQWGAEAMTVYIQGWLKGDFSVFDEISNIVERHLRALGGRKDAGVVPSILGARSAIAAAVQRVKATGQVTEAVLQDVYSAVGAADGGMQAYLKTTLQLAVATEKVRKAQDEVNRITQKYDQLLTPLQAKVKGISNQQENLDATRRISQLQLVLTDVNATEADKEAARMEIERLRAQTQINNLENQKAAELEVAQAKLDAAQAEQTLIQAQADAAKALVATQTEQNELIREQIQLLEQLAKASAGSGGDAGPRTPGGGIKLPSAPKPEPFVGNRRNVDIEGPAPETYGQFTNLKTAIDDLTTSLGNLSNAWAPVLEKAQPFTNWISENIGPITTFVGTFAATAIVLGILAGAIAAIAGLVNPVTLLIGAIALLAAIVVTCKDRILGAMYAMGGIITLTFLKVRKDIDDFLINGLSAWKGNWEMFKVIVADAWKIISDGAAKFINGIIKFFTDLYDDLVGHSIIPDMMTEIYDSIVGKLGEILTEVGGWIDNVITTIEGKVQSVIDVGASIINGLKEGASTAWEEFIGWFDGVIALLPDKVKKILGIASPSKVFEKLAYWIPAGMAKGIQKGIDLPRVALNSVLDTMISAPSQALVSPPAVSYHNTTNMNLQVLTNNSPALVVQSYELLRATA